MIENFELGDIVRMKKKHPCSKDAFDFEILRLGADIKIKCVNCGKIIMLQRSRFVKGAKKIIKSSSENKEA